MKKIFIILVVLSLPVLASSQIPGEGLMGYWPFNENAWDESLHGNNGTVYGATLTKDRFGFPDRAYYFDGHSRIEITDNPTLSLGQDQFTISAWIKLREYSKDDAYYLMGQFESPGNTKGWMIFIAESGIGFLMTSSGSEWRSFADYSVGLDQWYLIVVRRNGNTVTTFVNGIGIVSSPITIPTVDPNSTFYIGTAELSHPDRTFHGKADEIRIYNRALNDPEIQALYDMDKTTLHFTSGWNLFSLNLTNDSTDMKFLFQPLIADGSLVKIQDETGNALENYGIFGDWKNNIGDLSLHEGYKIKVNNNCNLVLQGKISYLPLPVPLKEGWNIIGYPKAISVNAQLVVQELMDRKTLIKVQDETGNALEDFGIFGGWKNNIGTLKPGEGYKMKVSADETLTYRISYQPPGIPNNPVPSDNLMGISKTPTLSWECTDPDGEALTYDVWFGNSEGAMELACSNRAVPDYAITKVLNLGTLYFWKVVARDTQNNTTEGPVWRFRVLNETGTFTDARDNKKYKWVKIGTQTWMAENLAWLPAVVGPWISSTSYPYYYVYGYSGMTVSEAKEVPGYSVYGVLYNLTAAITACPSGWHLAKDAEWTTMIIFLGGGSVAGAKMKEAGTAHWIWGAYYESTNESGFTALPGGCYKDYYGFNGMGDGAYWWTPSEYTAARGLYIRLLMGPSVEKYDIGGDVGYSVRCIKN